MSSTSFSSYTDTGINLASGGAYTSPFTITTAGTVESSGNYAVETSETAAYVLNDGIAASNEDGVELLKGGIVVNAAGGFISGGYPASGVGVLIEGASGTVSNDGTIEGAQGIDLQHTGSIINAGAVYGPHAGLFLNDGGAVTNSGTVKGDAVGIYLKLGGTVTNLGTASYILGFEGIEAKLGAVTVTNEGRILNGIAVAAYRGGVIVNSGAASYIFGSTAGVVVEGSAGTVVNAGYLYGGDAGSNGGAVVLEAGGTVINTGTIASHNTGVSLTDGGTVINAGTISNDYNTGSKAGAPFAAVYFSGGSGKLVADPGAVFKGLVIATGASNVLELGSGAAAGTLAGLGGVITGFQTIAFDPGAAWTLSGVEAGFNNTTLGGFTYGDTLDISDLGFTSNHTAMLGPAGTLDIGADVITFASAPAGEVIAFTSDGHSGTYLTEIPCFCAGTRILTTEGEVPVEALRVGDHVVTVREGGPLTSRIVWTGRRVIDIQRHPEPESARPVRILAGAFGTGVPARDLRLSPHHAIYAEGELFEAAALINGISIFAETRTTRVTYFHIELEAHDIMLAEGLGVESYLDTGTRDSFETPGAPVQLHPAFRMPASAASCVPLHREGAAAERLRDALAARVAYASTVGHPRHAAGT